MCILFQKLLRDKSISIMLALTYSDPELIAGGLHIS